MPSSDLCINPQATADLCMIDESIKFYDISTAVFFQSFSILQTTFPTDMSWNDNGSKMYVVDVDNDNIFEYNVPTNYDVSTAVFFQSFSIAPQTTFPTYMSWNDNGSKMYVVDGIGDRILEYNVPTNYDVSTAVFFQSFSVTSQTVSPVGITWNDNGSKMYTIDTIDDLVLEYNVG